MLQVLVIFETFLCGVDFMFYRNLVTPGNIKRVPSRRRLHEATVGNRHMYSYHCTEILKYGQAKRLHRYASDSLIEIIKYAK